MFNSAFYPLGCMAGYKLDDDISACVELEQNVMSFFKVVAIQIISLSRLTVKKNVI